MLSKPKKIQRVYLDHAATTPTISSVVKVMSPYQEKWFGNAGALYALGRQSQAAIEGARQTIAAGFNCQSDTILFTSGGTEGDNLALIGVARAMKAKGRHIISTAVEHHAVLHALETLKAEGFEVTLLPVNAEGLVSVEDLKRALRPDTVLISIMYANNEMGAIQPLADIGRALLKYRKERQTAYPYFHTDACQAAQYLEMDVEKLHVDLMVINGSKIYGPKGVGAMYVRRGTPLVPMIYGGSQERGRRAGTENVPGIVGLAEAYKLVRRKADKESARLTKLSEYFWSKLQKTIPKIRLNGPAIGGKRLPNNLNVSFMDIEGEAMVLYLDEFGIMCSTGSACTSTSLEPSHVLRAMGMPYEYAHGSLRFTLGQSTVKSEIDYVLKHLPNIVKLLREMSPVNTGAVKHARYKK